MRAVSVRQSPIIQYLSTQDGITNAPRYAGTKELDPRGLVSAQPLSHQRDFLHENENWMIDWVQPLAVQSSGVTTPNSTVEITFSLDSVSVYNTEVLDLYGYDCKPRCRNRMDAGDAKIPSPSQPLGLILNGANIRLNGQSLLKITHFEYQSYPTVRFSNHVFFINHHGGA